MLVPMGRAQGSQGQGTGAALRGGTFARDWRVPENVEAALCSLCEGRDTFPGPDDFKAAGLTGLYLTLKGNRELGDWAAKMGLKGGSRGRSAGTGGRSRSSSGGAGRPISWTDEAIEAALKGLCEGREVFPGPTDFKDAGLGGLYATLVRRGSLGDWAAKMGLKRPTPGNPDSLKWTEAAIQGALDDLCEGQETFPTQATFKEAGLGGLYATLYKNEALDEWAEKMGLERNSQGSQGATVWTEEAIETAVTELCEGLDRFPGAREFREAGLQGLWSKLIQEKALDEWAEKMGLERRAKAAEWTDESIEAALRELCEGKEMFPSVREFKAAGVYGLYHTMMRKGELAKWAEKMGLERREVDVLDEDRVYENEKVTMTDLEHRLDSLNGVDLRRLQHRQTGQVDDTQRSKSWAQGVVRRLLGPAAEGLPIRVVPARVDASGALKILSTMPLAPVLTDALRSQAFADSEAAFTLSDLVLVVREDDEGTSRKRKPGDWRSSKIVEGRRFRLADHPEVAEQVARDYEEIRAHVLAGGEVRGDMGKLMQARTKGQGGDEERTFSFYARPALIEAMVASGEKASHRANEDARASRALQAKRPSEEELAARLEAFLDGRPQERSFPGPKEFREAGQEELYWQLRASREMSQWGDEMGVPYRTTVEWSGPRIEEGLEELLAGRATWPSKGEFHNAGVEGHRLYERIEIYGGTKFWARWMGVLPRQPEEHDTEEALERFLAGRETWPTKTDFDVAGLGYLHSVVKRSERGFEGWQEHFDLQPFLWTEDRISSTLRSMTERLGHFPVLDEMQRDAGGLKWAVEESGGSVHWAKKLGLSEMRGRTQRAKDERARKARARRAEAEAAEAAATRRAAAAAKEAAASEARHQEVDGAFSDSVFADEWADLRDSVLGEPA
jgi:hypothetical protein